MRSCQRCGYALEGLPQGTRCPECGEQKPSLAWKRGRRWVLRWESWPSVVALLAFVVPYVWPMVMWVGLHRAQGSSAPARVVVMGSLSDPEDVWRVVSMFTVMGMLYMPMLVCGRPVAVGVRRVLLVAACVLILDTIRAYAHWSVDRMYLSDDEALQGIALLGSVAVGVFAVAIKVCSVDGGSAEVAKWMGEAPPSPLALTDEDSSDQR